MTRGRTMKSVLIFLAGSCTMILGLVLFQPLTGNLFRIRSVSHHKPASPPEPIGESILINYTEPVFIAARSGENFTLRFEAIAGAPIRYSWISTTDRTLAGNGELFSPGDQVAPLNRGLSIQLDQLELGWTPKSQTCGYLYFDSDQVSVTLEQE